MWKSPPICFQTLIYSISSNLVSPKKTTIDTTTENGQRDAEELPESSEVSSGPIAIPKVIKASGKGSWQSQDYPLFHPNNQPDNNSITGQELIHEMEKLKKMITLEPMPEEYKEYFFFVNARFPKMGLRDRAAFCRFCDHIPLSPMAFFVHLFSDEHISNLSKFKISKSSFEFWTNHLNHCRRIAAFRKSHEMSYLPLFDGDIWDSDKSRLEKEEIQSLVESFSNISEDDFINEKVYVSVIFRNPKFKDYCQACNTQMPLRIYHYAKHLFSEEHLSNIREVSQRDIDFWMHAFRIPAFEFMDPSLDETIIYKPIFDEIPLLETYGGPKKLNYSVIEQLVKLAENLKAGRGNEYLSNFYDMFAIPRRCNTCGIEFPNLFNNRKNIFPVTKHILSERHLKKLFGVPQAHVNFWINFLHLEVNEKKIRPVDKVRILSRKNTCPIPLIDFKLESDFMEQNERLPKIDWLYGIFEKIKEDELKNEPIKLGNTGKELVAQEVICYACERAKESFENNFQLVTHIFSRRHVNYLLKFGFSEKAFIWWKNTLESLVNPEDLKILEISGPIEEKPQSIQNEEAMSEALEKLKNCDIPRIPLLDKPEDGVEMSHSTRNPLWILGARIRERCTERQILRAQSMMNYMAPTSELQYWKTWANCIIQDTIVENIPKVPMLDRPDSQPNEVLISKQMDQVLGELGKTLDQIKIINYDKNAVLWTCSYCSDLKLFVYFGTKLEAWDHITSDEHKEKMVNKCTEAELEYWKEWITNLEIMSMKYEKKDYDICQRLHGDIYDRQRNSPRVPLIDLPQPFDTKISRDRFKLVYNGNRELLSILKPCEITEKHVDVTCHHCPGSPKFATVWETMQHVFNEIHAQNINYIGTSKDFFHYKLLLKRVLVKQPLPEPREQTSIPKPTSKELCYKLEMCVLPLFPSPLFRETGKYCRGPTNRQILFIQSLRVREDVKFFEKPMKCLLCQLDMSNFSILDVARHAFSIKHLEKALSRCNMFFVEEFEWWMEKLKTSSNLIPSEPSESAEYYVGGLKTIIGNRYIPVFEKLTEKELNLISNVDEQKVRENEEVLLRRFGGCIYCDLWIPTPTDIFPHFFSEQHFEKVREHHPVKQFDVDDVMSLVKLCQKSDC
ncbi:hypothetical protein L3Y34_013983 [Caenorhabditis briggsae]|uniref:Uncharacterized protein n=1 Tax=Caenorhabditis briggsae TaxID=6238 RepID=A0AAE9DQC5_CAEBR|nr:hypothetical protein L3Y34_013983 [Caenorhabditis briggsae]